MLARGFGYEHCCNAGVVVGGWCGLCGWVGIDSFWLPFAMIGWDPDGGDRCCDAGEVVCLSHSAYDEAVSWWVWQKVLSCL